MIINDYTLGGHMRYGVIALVTTALTFTAMPGALATETPEPESKAALANTAPTDVVRSGVPTKAIERVFARTTERKAMTLESRAGYHIYDYEYDGYDSVAYPELLGAVATVATDSPDRFIVAGVTETYTSGYSRAYLHLDTNGDGNTDYITGTPTSYMGLDLGYSMPIGKVNSDNTVTLTTQNASWLRTDDGYGVSIAWRSLGVQNVRWSMGTVDSYGDSDYVPNLWSGTLDLMTGQYPPPVATPPATTTNKPSSVRLTVKRNGFRSVKAKWTKSAGATKYSVQLRSRGKTRYYQTTSRSKVWWNLKPGAYTVKVWPTNGSGVNGSTASHWIRVKK